MKTAVSGILSILLLLGMWTLVFKIQPVIAATITVPDDYPTIQAAINAASDGDMVFVRNGTYYEKIVVDKTVWLVGESEEATVIDANYTGIAVNIAANFVNVSSFTIQHASPFSIEPDLLAGIYILNASNTRLAGNIIQQNGVFGVRISDSVNCTIVNNTIRDNGYNGIVIARSEYCLIDNNTFTGNGIWFHDDAIVSYAGGYNIISNNLFLGNNNGIMISNEEDDMITGNTVRSSWLYNLFLWTSFDCLVKHNVFADCQNGIRAGQGGGNTICQNLIENNSYGVWFDWEYPPWWYNSFYLNNFMNNTVQTTIPTTMSSTWDDGCIQGNYWSDYTGTDVDGNGINDTPYIVSGDNVDNYPLMEPYSSLAVVASVIRASKTVLGQGYTTTIALNVTARNYGEQAESFNLTFDMLGTEFETELTLASRDSTTFAFTLNTTGFTIGNYTVWSYVSPLSGEEALGDNTRSLTIRVVIPGDVSGPRPGAPDGKVNMLDIAYMISLYQTKPNKSNWNSNADVDNDGVVDMKDIAIAVAYFNQHE